MTAKLAELRKAAVAVLGVIAAALAQGLIPHPVNDYVSAALGVLAAAGVYVVPNAAPAPAATLAQPGPAKP